MLKEFLFPILLAVFGAIVAVPSFYYENNLGRVLRTAGALVFCLAIAVFLVGFIWADPVHGPFYKLLRPNSTDEFRIHGGGGTFVVSTKEIASGVDFSRIISIPNNPINISFKKTWWSGAEYKASIIDNDKVILQFDNKKLDDKNLPSGWDVNYDQNAFELVDENKIPRLQIIQSADNDVYINYILVSGNMFTINRENTLLINVSKAKAEENLPDRIFKYPSYINQSQRL